jgi:hypothetical protein
MKRFLILICLLCSYGYIVADIIPVGQKSIPYCVKIQNSDSFPNVAFVLVVNPVNETAMDAVQIKSSECLSKGDKINCSKIYALNKSYLEAKGTGNIDFTNDRNVLLTNISVPALTFQYVPYDSQVKDIQEYYRIFGFTDSSTVLYLSKRITIYDDDYKDSVLFSSPAEFENIKSSIGNYADIKSIRKTEQFLLYPSPSQENLNLVILNNRFGNVIIELFDMAGHKLSNYYFAKNQEELKKTLDIKNLRSGIYNLRCTLGDHVENRLFLKK